MAHASARERKVSRYRSSFQRSHVAIFIGDLAGESNTNGEIYRKKKHLASRVTSLLMLISNYLLLKKTRQAECRCSSSAIVITLVNLLFKYRAAEKSSD